MLCFVGGFPPMQLAFRFAFLLNDSDGDPGPLPPLPSPPPAPAAPWIGTTASGSLLPDGTNCTPEARGRSLPESFSELGRRSRLDRR